MKRFLNAVAVFLAATIVLPVFGGIRVSAANDEIPITSKYFEDANFRKVLSQTYDEDGNGSLSDKELKGIYNLHCENMHIKSLDGIQYLKYTVGLWCKGNEISSLDLSQNKELVGVWCSNNKIKTLDFSNNLKIEWIYCTACQLTSLNVSKNTKLGYLECNDNPDLKSLNLKNNSELEHLFASKCGLTSLDLSGNPKLCEMTANYNKLTSLNVSKNTKLKRLDVWHNVGLTKLDVSNLKELNYLNIAWNNMDVIDVTHNPQLAELVCSHNNIRSIDLSKNPKLAFLVIDCNIYLEKLDVSKNPKLYYFFAYGLSKIDTIDISKNSRLCKAYNEGVYAHEDKIGRVYSKEINYGGSSDPFDELRHIVAFDDDAKIIANYNGTNDVPDCYINTNDGHSNSERFATRQEAMWLLYEMAGEPAVSGSPSFKDVDPNSPYAKAIKWGQDNKICFGYPRICDDTFCGNELINREDFALMAHRYAGVLKLGTSFDYGRTDWLDDFADIDFYGWAAFTWAIQFKVLQKTGNKAYPHGRMTWDEVQAGALQVFHLDEAASYADRTSDGKEWAPPSSTTPYTPGQMPPAPYGGYTIPSGSAGSFEDFVERLYVVALGRASEADGKAHWCKVVGNGSYTGADAARFFFTCPEFEGKNLSNEDYVKTLYATFFDRNATDDPDGYNFWLSKINDWGRRRVLEGFIDSAEWCNICADYGVRSGASTAKATRASKNATDFATRLYTECLGRDPETDGLNYWSLSLTNQERTGSQAAKEFFYCPEFKDKNLGDEEYINRLYKTFMGRNPDDDGKNYWLGQLGNGTMNRDQIFDFFSTCEEFTDICNQYAILR